jgi:hypothetical protein
VLPLKSCMGIAASPGIAIRLSRLFKIAHFLEKEDRIDQESERVMHSNGYVVLHGSSEER